LDFKNKIAAGFLSILVNLFIFIANKFDIQLPMQKLFTLLLVSIFLIACNKKTKVLSDFHLKSEQKKQSPVIAIAKADSVADAATIIQRRQVPILCYHRIENKNTSSDYTVSVASFKEQMKLLADSGYHTILPDQLYDYLTKGMPLPPKPFMLTFDDTRLEQYTIAAPEMEKYGFRGVFFVMTIPIGRPNYMNSEQIKELSDKGHVIGSHTWDHHNVKQLKGNDWIAQIEKPNQRLLAITGKPVTYFAYPFGVWNDTAVTEIKKYPFKAAFQLTAKRSETDPLYTIRRTLVPGSWPTSKLLKRMQTMF
jgi:peptidoglycan/xylan/chitin deacetylase (PgdA/CDA1 family)